MAGLETVSIRAPTLRFHDAAGADATATDAALALVRNETTWTASLGARVGTGRISAHGELAKAAAQHDLTLELEGLQPRALSAFAPGLHLAGVALPVSGTVQLLIDPAMGARAAATFDLVAEAGEVAVDALGLDPTAIHAGALRGRIEAGWQAAEIEQFRLAGQGFGLSGRGRIELVDSQLATDLELSADDFDLPELLPLWPTSVAADARSWVARNVVAARIAGAALHLGGGSDRPGQPDLGGSLAFSGVELRYHDKLPPAVDAAGTASLTGDSLVVRLTGGRTGEVAIGKSEAVLSNLMGAGVTRLRARLDLRSNLAAAFRLLDAGPFELSRNDWPVGGPDRRPAGHEPDTQAAPNPAAAGGRLRLPGGQPADRGHDPRAPTGLQPCRRQRRGDGGAIWRER